MRSRSMWLRSAAYVALGTLGALWSLVGRDTVLTAPASFLQLPARWNLLVGTLLTLALSWLAVQATRVWVAHARWASRLHIHLRSGLLGTTTSQMVLLAGLSACSEELLFRAALGPSIGFVNSCALFALLHTAPAESYFARATWTFGVGLAFSALYLASGSLLAPIAAHWLINYENMQYICNYDPTPLDMDALSSQGVRESDR